MVENIRFLFDKKVGDDNGAVLLSGSDEVGRGAMAGPIVVASVILPNDYYNPLIKDSKKLSASQRKKLSAEIKKVCISFAFSIITSNDVDKFNPKKSSIMGMVESIKNLSTKPDICLIDAENLNIESYKCLSFIKGDDKSQAIAAASILAKVERDSIMNDYHTIYPLYSFNKHKGYCTKLHLEMVNVHGVTPIHRISYKPIKDILYK